MGLVVVVVVFDTLLSNRVELNNIFIGPIANLKGPYFQPSLSVCL